MIRKRRVERLLLGGTLAASLTMCCLACDYSAASDSVGIRQSDNPPVGSTEQAEGSANEVEGNDAAPPVGSLGESVGPQDGSGADAVTEAVGGATTEGVSMGTGQIEEEKCAPEGPFQCFCEENEPSEYDLPHYDGDATGLCPPAEAVQCRCRGDIAAAVVTMCTPDGRACVLLGGFCTSDPSECGWGAVRAVCPELEAVFDAATDDTADFCASDLDCKEGHYCNQRVANRMFCDDATVARAEEVCPTGAVDAGTPDGGK